MKAILKLHPVLKRRRRPGPAVAERLPVPPAPAAAPVLVVPAGRALPQVRIERRPKPHSS